MAHDKGAPGQAQAVINALVGAKGVQPLLSRRLHVSGAAEALKTWKTIKLGTGLQTARDFRNAFKNAGVRTEGWANYFLVQSALTVVESATEVELVAASVDELGFWDQATFKEVCARAEEFGLDPCPPEAALQLCLQCADQLNHGLGFVIATPSPINLYGKPYLFRVVHKGNGCDIRIDRDGKVYLFREVHKGNVVLGAYHCTPNDPWYARPRRASLPTSLPYLDTHIPPLRFVFVRRKSALVPVNPGTL